MSMVSQMFFPGTFFFVRRYAKKIPKKKAIAVATRATRIERIIGSNILFLLILL